MYPPECMVERLTRVFAIRRFRMKNLSARLERSRTWHHDEILIADLYGRTGEKRVVFNFCSPRRISFHERWARLKALSRNASTRDRVGRVNRLAFI
jgi:hypothetical protein